MMPSVPGLDEAPMPQLNITWKIPYKHQVVWYALLHFEAWPIMTNDIYRFLRELDVDMSPSVIGHVMKDFCSRGYFQRRKTPKIYEYTPNEMFLVRQREYMEAGV